MKDKKSGRTVCEPKYALTKVSIGDGYVRACPSCGEEQRLELRSCNTTVYDQPYCSVCRTR